jgi:predicted CopG family antitoxin
MGRYTTITVNREILRDLERVKKELNAESLGETIERLISFWREVRAKEFVNEVLKVRDKGGFNEIRKVINEIRDLEWARSI